ncbi:probable LRR receptor-like serine/threonine-protein kinase At3g47570 [Malania oleifera]|uniref:probable LRR receptor-like serine/threonine-protein kinase At3g47570 n=1 Tax=Malania oleifera TaxID=397392 RepID=UPI0025ADA7D8|nr:probable LRR receptor-like serine/threonine-protein kinase At3g47570 [Malania oleifera]
MKASLLLIILSSLFSFLDHSQALRHPRFDNSTDQDALLSFKSHVTKDPSGVLDGWNPNTSFCTWPGVLFNPNKNRVTGLSLRNLSLTGTISPHITNLSFLRSLDLQNNSFHGAIPIDIGRLFRLESLILASNHIDGSIPLSLSYCLRLRVVDLSKNRLKGAIPSELGNLSKLQDLRFRSNNLTGSIPFSLGNLSYLNNLILISNNLQGPIPSELGQLTRLQRLKLADNDLSGVIPASLFNMSSLIFFTLAKNRISGRLPSDLFWSLPSLETLFVGGNLLEGDVPSSLSNASNLEFVDLSTNQFSGQVPLLWNLPNLLFLSLEINQLVSEGKHGLDFLTSLANSTSLRALSIATNQLTGELPASMGNLSRQLSELFMGENHFEGNIPESIGNLAGLTLLSLELNSFSGKIPSAIGNLQNLQILILDLNFLSGSIPESLGNLSHLYELGLSTNSLTGSIPTILLNCQHLQRLDLSINSLDGNIPKEIFGFPSLGVLFNISWNSLTGVLPAEIGNLKMVQNLDISKNNLSGAIPSTVGDCSNLMYLDMSSNSFQGHIPTSLTNLKGIEYIDLSSNNLSGPIPSSLKSLLYLKLLNLSSNRLQGEVPKGGIFLNSSSVFLTGNSEICGGIPEFGLSACSTSKNHSHASRKALIIGVIAGSTAILFLILFCIFITLYVRRNRQIGSRGTSVISFEGPHRFYSLYDIKSATNNFNDQNLIGEGSFGSVYKGVMRDGTLVAVKVFNMDLHGASKSFLAECEALRNIRHRNLVKILTACSSSTFKALVLQFMPNESLDRWLHHERGEQKKVLTLKQRLEITINVASAMEYLHHECETPVVHCDLKPSNVLLDQDMTAHVADFGLARMLRGTASNHHTSSSVGLKGSIGYIAPEYGFGGNVSTKGDVYSYGIILLEMFTGKKPIEGMFSGEMTLQKWVGAAVQEQVVEILDDGLRECCKEGVVSDSLSSILKIGLSCASEAPEDRPDMKDVSAMIKRAMTMVIHGVRRSELHGDPSI